MLLLTWHGTILRVEQSQNRLIHVPLVPVRPASLDLTYAGALPGGLTLHPGPQPGAAHIARDGKTLRITAESPFLAFDAVPAIAENGVLPIADEEAAALRALLSAPSRDPAAGTEFPCATLRPGFVLSLGDFTFDLTIGRPTLTDTGITLPDGTHLTQTSPELPAELALVPAEPAAATIRRGGPEQHFLPLTASFATRDWFYSTATQPPLVGTHRLTQAIRHAAPAWLLALDGAPAILNREGLLRPLPPAPAPILPDIVAREADTLYLSEAALTDAAWLPGPHALLPPPADRPIVNGVLPLLLLAPLLPPQTRLLSPPPADLLALFGLAFETASAPTPLCQVESLHWPDPAVPMQADIVRAARAMAHEIAPRPESGRRILLTEGLANPARACDAAAAYEYETSVPLPTDPAGLAALFASAVSLIAASHAWLEYLLFCRPGAQIIELAPDSAWDPTFARLSNQLGLVHAVLPCPSQDGALNPDPAALRRLLRILQVRA